MEKLTLGIDEAGRGPVIGPLVMCGIILNETEQKNLAAIGVKDSKLLTPEKREELYSQILSISPKYKIIVLGPETIDAALSSSSLNLNWLEAHTSAEILNELDPEAAIIDCPSTNIKAYKDYLYNLIKNKRLKLTLEHKAEKYTPAAAASIIAKVTRDRIIEQLKKDIGINFGSGYMSDPTTQKFLEKYHLQYPNLFRKNWQPYKDAINKKSQKKLGEF